MEGIWLKEGDGTQCVVFVHGILSSGETCWTHESGAYWPNLVAKDKKLDDFGVYVFTYKTNIFSGSFSLGDVVDSLKEHMDVDGVLDRKEIVFVCHSMGGLAVRRFIVKHAIDLAELDRDIALFLVASPSLGSNFANWLSPIATLFGHSQAEALKFGEENRWLTDLDKDFFDLKAQEKLRITGKELLEDNFIILRSITRTQVVPRIAGARYFPQPYKVPNSDHFSIAKPKSENEIQHRLLRKFILGRKPIKQSEKKKVDLAPKTPHEENGDQKDDPNLAPPNFGQTVSREKFVAHAIDLARKHPILCVAGLPGNGKTHLVSELVKSLDAGGDRTLWFEASPNDSVEPLLAACSRHLGEHLDSIASQCKQLVQAIASSRLMLVIDDFHHVDKASYLPLLRAAARQLPPSMLILISRLHPDELSGEPAAAVLHIKPFSRDETEELLALRGLPIEAGLIEELWRKTGGLPLAMTLFCTLIQQFGYAPQDLLFGDLVGIDRLRKWFEEINSLVTQEAARLLRLLSLVEGPFDRTIVRLLSREILQSDDTNPFFLLNRSFLVEAYGENRWRVHDLVSSMCRGGMDAKVAGAVHRTLGFHFNRISGGWWNRPRADVDLQNKIRACKHFTASGHTSHDATRLANLIVPELKRRGYYLQLIDLIAPLRRAGGGTWLDYHYAHSCLILGRLTGALQAAEDLVHSDLSTDPNLKIAAYRLYAEAVAKTGDFAFAQKILFDALATSDLTRVNGVTRRQAQVVLASFELKIGRADLAQERLAKCLKEAELVPDDRGVAVAKMWIAISHIAEAMLEDAENLISSALARFVKVGDVRGEAWACFRLAEVRLALGFKADNLPELARASQIYDELELCDEDYITFIKRLLGSASLGEKIQQILARQLAKCNKLTTSFA